MTVPSLVGLQWLLHDAWPMSALDLPHILAVFMFQDLIFSMHQLEKVRCAAVCKTRPTYTKYMPLCDAQPVQQKFPTNFVTAHLLQLLSLPLVLTLQRLSLLPLGGQCFLCICELLSHGPQLCLCLRCILRCAVQQLRYAGLPPPVRAVCRYQMKKRVSSRCPLQTLPQIDVGHCNFTTGATSANHPGRAMHL